MFAEPARRLSRADPRRRRVPVPLLDGIASLAGGDGRPGEGPPGPRVHASPPLDPPPDVPTRDLTVDGPHGPVPVRVYGDAPDGSGRPALLWMHGGALHDGRPRHARGRLDRARGLRPRRRGRGQRRLPARGRRRAPPGAARRLVAAARWLRDPRPSWASTRTGSRSAAPAPAATWPTAAVLRLRDEDGWQPAALIPVYPVLHAALPDAVARGSRRCWPRSRRCCRFTPEGTAGINANYLGGRSSRPTATRSPPSPTSPASAPTLLITAEYDDLRTPARPSPTSSRAAGVDVRHVQRRRHAARLPQPLRHARAVDAVLELMAETVSTSTTLAP